MYETQNLSTFVVFKNNFHKSTYKFIMKKVLMVLTSEFPPDQRVENEAEALIEAGFEVHLACFTRKQLPERDVHHSIIIHRKKISNFYYKSLALLPGIKVAFRFWGPFLSRLIRQHSFDALHFHDLPLAELGFRLKKKFGIKYVLDLHENWPVLQQISEHTQHLPGSIFFSFPAWLKYERQAAKDADRVVVVIDEMKQRLATMGIDRSKIEVVQNTINIPEDLPVTARTEDEKDDISLFYGGGVTIHRGLQVVLYALSGLPANSHIKFHIVGSGRYIITLKQLARDLKIENRVAFHGHKPQQELYAELAKSDVAIIPHLKTDHTDHTIPHKLFQYMYYGKPVIATNCLPIQRIVNETNTGIIYNNDDPNALTRILQTLEIDADAFKAQYSAGKKWVLEKYNWQYDAQRLVSLYKGLFP